MIFIRWNYEQIEFQHKKYNQPGLLSWCAARAILFWSEIIFFQKYGLNFEKNKKIFLFFCRAQLAVICTYNRFFLNSSSVRVRVRICSFKLSLNKPATNQMTNLFGPSVLLANVIYKVLSDILNDTKIIWLTTVVLKQMVMLYSLDHQLTI